MRWNAALLLIAISSAAGTVRAERPSVAIVLLGEVNLDRAQSSRIGDRLGDALQSEFQARSIPATTMVRVPLSTEPRAADIENDVERRALVADAWVSPPSAEERPRWSSELGRSASNPVGAQHGTRWPELESLGLAIGGCF